MTFITEDFLLHGEFAKRLYHGYAKDLPIIDYHCHLSPRDIATNRVFRTLTEIWLEGDHYKWRAMRALGIDEHYITGSANDEEKFIKWAGAIPYTMRNPLYHWTHLELLRYFQVTDLLSPATAAATYATANQLLATPSFATRSLLTRMKVEMVGTTDDPTDSLEWHAQLGASSSSLKVLPTFRPDQALAIERADYVSYIRKLEASSNQTIRSLEDLLRVLESRVDYFHQKGGLLADHGLTAVPLPQSTERSLDHVFVRALNGESPNADEAQHFKFHVLVELSKMYHQRQWVQQFHLGAIRNTNSRLLSRLGADAGVDSIGDFSQAGALAHFLNELDQSNQLTKTILYNLNPSDNEMMASMAGNFNDGSVKGKIQYGSAWWFLDQKDGMEKQINTLSNLGLISCFIGMLTDSRSFLSYPRHEYFRRILCNLIGRDVDAGELPRDEEWLGKLVANVCYYNAKEYFKMN